MKTHELDARLKRISERMETFPVECTTKIDPNCLTERERRLIQKVGEIYEKYAPNLPPVDVMFENWKLFSKVAQIVIERTYDLFVTVMSKAFYGDEIEEHFFKVHFFNFNDNYVWNLLQNNSKETPLLEELISRFRGRQRLKMIKEIHGMAVSGRQEPAYSKLTLIEKPSTLEFLSEKSSVPKDWIFYSLPKPLEILSNADEEEAVHVLNEDRTSVPIAKDPHSVISMLYNSYSLSARVYTKDEYETPLLNGIMKCFD